VSNGKATANDRVVGVNYEVAFEELAQLVNSARRRDFRRHQFASGVPTGFGYESAYPMSER
jgi:hypothetical protein